MHLGKDQNKFLNFNKHAVKYETRTFWRALFLRNLVSLTAYRTTQPQFRSSSLPSLLRFARLRLSKAKVEIANYETSFPYILRHAGECGGIYRVEPARRKEID